MDKRKDINRRTFLSLLASSVGALLICGRSAAAQPILSASSVPVPLCRCQIAGFQYYEGLAVIPTLKDRQRLILQREPKNPHDRFAISVHTASGRKLGYLPRRLNEIPAKLMDDGHQLAAILVSVTPAAPPWEILEMEILLGNIQGT